MCTDIYGNLFINNKDQYDLREGISKVRESTCTGTIPGIVGNQKCTWYDRINCENWSEEKSGR